MKGHMAFNMPEAGPWKTHENQNENESTSTRIFRNWHFHFPLASFDSVYLRVTQFGYKMNAHNAEFGDKKRLEFGCKTMSEKVDNRNIFGLYNNVNGTGKGLNKYQQNQREGLTFY